MSVASPGPADVTVSVCMITYNHERFIAQAIESVLMQQTGFAVELVIGEDCSTDGTRATVRDYEERYPSRIRLLLPEHNLGMMPNFVATLSACRGHYVALLEGDDYWTDPLKLQKQVDFLEAHPECALCLHAIQVVYEDGTRLSLCHHAPGHEQLFILEDVLNPNPALSQTQTAAVMFRNGLLPHFPDWFYSCPIGDVALVLLLAEHGKIGYLGDVMSVWRKHAGGAWNGMAERDQLLKVLLMYDLFDAHLGYRYTATLEPGRAVCHYGLALDCWLKSLREEQAYWLDLVTKAFPRVSEPLLTKVVGSAQEVEALHGYRTADDAVNWICNAVRTQSTGPAWSKRARREWYAGYAYKAHQRSDNAAVRRASWCAVQNDWRILRNRGFVWRWLSAIVGSRTWEALRQFPHKALARSDERPI